MSLNQFASLQLAPLIARVVLATIVLPSGYVSLFRTSDFSAQDAQRIEAMGNPAAVMEGAVEKVKPVSWRVETEGGADKEESGETGSGGRPMRNLNRFILRLDDAKVPQPLIVGWTCAIAEIVGGIALLAGLCTRLFALLNLVGGSFHIWLVTWPSMREAMPWDWQVGTMHSTAAAAAAVLISLSLLLTGPGRFSFDKILFGKHQAD